MKFNWQKQIIFLLPVVLLGGCATEPTRTEAAFGDSVRNMVQAQTLNPSVLTDPSDEVIDSTDGQKLEGVLEAYRTVVADPASASSGVTISLD
jgi:type IV pilus biogenesis protein CpaD/CtpE